MKRACIYIRVSTESQAEQVSPITQENDCKQYADNKGYSIVDVYRDVEKYRIGKRLVEPSGTRADRPQLKRMLSDGKAGKFDVILAWREDRLYRSYRPMLEVLETVEQYPIEIELIKDTFDKTFAPIKAWAAKMELDARKQRIMMGFDGRLSKGKGLNNQTPYGYSRDDDGYYIENESESIWVKRIFQWYSEGVSIGDIRFRLINGGAIQKGKNIKIPWHKSIIRKYLKKCDYYWTGQMKINWNKNVYFIPLPALVDKSLVDKVKNRRESYKLYPSGNLKTKALASGLVYCKHCGVRMAVIGMTNGYIKKGATEPIKHPYYSCGSYQHRLDNGTCAKRINVKTLDKIIWQKLLEFITQPQIFNSSLQTSLGKQQNKNINPQEEYDRITSELENNQIERQKIISLYRKNIINDDDLKIQIDVLTQEEKRLSYELNEVAILLSNQPDRLIAFAEEYRNRMINGLDWLQSEPKTEEEIQALFQTKKKFVQGLIKRIEVNSDKQFSMTLIWNITSPFMNINIPLADKRIPDIIQIEIVI